MAKEYIATSSLTFRFQNPAHSGTVSVITPSNPNMKIDSLNTYAGIITVSISNGTDGSITNATGIGTISPTSIFTKLDSNYVIREGDQSISIVMTGQNPSPPPPTSTYTTVIIVDTAGQTSTKSD